MALRKGKIVEPAGVQCFDYAQQPERRSRGERRRKKHTDRKLEAYGKKQEKFSSAPLLPCSSAILTPPTLQLNLVPFASQCESIGCLYPYLETKKLLDGSTFIKKAKTKKPSPKLDVCKNFDNTKLKPVLPDDAPIAVVLFAGGGGIEAGMVQAGIRPVIAVEFDPTKPDLSRAIALNHHRNFSEYGCRIIQLTVQEIAQSGFIGFPRRPDYLHASPVCANFSQAHTAKAGIALETADDVTAAIAVAEAIRQLQPRVFTLENVPRYQNSQSFAIILDALEQEGYSINYSVVNMADFGLPQARRRLVLVASRGCRVALPLGTTPCGWYEAIAHLILTMPDSQLLPKQRQAVEQFLTANEPTSLLLERVGGRNGMKYKPGHLPCNTILRCLRRAAPTHFTDHKGCNRSKFADIWLPDGTVKSLSIEGAAILQGFPGWYEFPNEIATAGSIIGYCVPPSFAAQLFTHIQKQLSGGFL